MDDQSSRLLSVAAATVVTLLLLIQMIHNINVDRRKGRIHLGHITSSRPTKGAYKRLVPLLIDDDDEEGSNKQQQH